MAGSVSAVVSAVTVLLLAEIERGEGLTLSAAGRLFPAHRGKGSVDPSTVWRWRTSGAPAADGSTVKLECVRVGGRWLTSRSAVARFVDALSADPAAALQSPAERTAASDRAAAELERMGA